MNVVHLVLAVVLLLAVTTCFVPIRRDPLTGMAFVTGWIVGEMAGQILVAEVLLVSLITPLHAHRGWVGSLALVLDGFSALGLLVLCVVGFRSRAVVRRGLAEVTGLEVEPMRGRPRWLRWWRSILVLPIPGRHLRVDRNLDYFGDGDPAHRLDVIRPAGAVEGAPVMVYVHGGAWIIGDKREQGKPMLYELASRGWVCVSVNYRLSPKATWPDAIVDVMAALAWVREHIGDYGGDPSSFLALSGGSAGGQLAALAALAPGDPAFQPGFESADTSVDACVPFYGVHDMLAMPVVGGSYGPGLRMLLERQVFKASMDDERERFEAASPLHRIHENAPAFLVVHGTKDTLVPVAVPRRFVADLRATSTAPVGYFEMPLAQHAFEVFCSPRCSSVVQGTVAFLDALRVQKAIKAGRSEDSSTRG